MRRDIMVDIETLGKKSDSTIFQISAISFDINTGEHYEVFNQIADVEKNIFDLKVDGSTLKWWLNTDRNLLTMLLNEGEESSEKILENFYEWLIHQSSNDMKDVYLWGNGILFDNKMIQTQLENLGAGYPIFYKNDRDVRTIVELASMKSGISEKELKDQYNDGLLVAHNALDDVKYQIKLAVGCYSILTEYKREYCSIWIK